MIFDRVAITPFTDQLPGTSGLRKRVAVFQQPHYVAAFIQAILDTVPGTSEAPIVLGGDGRYFAAEAIEVVLRVAAANGAREILVGRDGLLSTPAASHLIRRNGACCGIILSASHNPGGPDGDFGVKLNVANGGPAPEAVTAALAARASELREYRIADLDPVPLGQLGTFTRGPLRVTVVDPVADYAELMETLIDFAAIRALAASGFRVCFDGMNAVTGPYAREILERRLGFAAGTVIRGEPLPDFGGGHPDPNLAHATELVHIMNGASAPDFGAASDGDGDRNMVLGRSFFVTPSDSLAVLAANAHLIPGYTEGLTGVARSMPTSRAVDVVAERIGIRSYETPTGWKFFGNLMDAGRVALCGEESFGTGSDHIREKDGLWAVLCWLNILAARRESVEAIVRHHWSIYGRHYYARHDYEEIPAVGAAALMTELRARLSDLPGRTIENVPIAWADEFDYTDPVDGSVSVRQGIRLGTANGGRIVVRLSGTGTAGATLRLYFEQFEPDPARHALADGDVLRPLVEAAEPIMNLRRHTGRATPTLVT